MDDYVSAIKYDKYVEVRSELTGGVLCNAY